MNANPLQIAMETTLGRGLLFSAMKSFEVRLRDAAGQDPYYAAVIVSRDILRVRRVDYLEVYAVVGGSGRQVTTHRPTGTQHVRRLHPGQLLLLRPTDDQTIDAPAEGLAILGVAFPLADWQAFVSYAGLDERWCESIPPPTGSFDPADDELRGAFDTVFARFREGPIRLDLIQFWASVIPRILPPDRSGRPRASHPEWLTRSLDAMRAEENLRAGVPRLLELAHVSRQHLSATTQRFLGTTPTETVARIRLAHAAVLLTSTPQSIATIAERCGFSSAAYFSNCFKAIYFASPREYRSRSASRRELAVGVA